jgi:hypothetical protein
MNEAAILAMRSGWERQKAQVGHKVFGVAALQDPTPPPAKFAGLGLVPNTMALALRPGKPIYSGKFKQLSMVMQSYANICDLSSSRFWKE